MKSEIIAQLGQTEICLPSLIAAGLSANDRVKARLSVLQAALFYALAELDLPVICVETRQMGAVLKAQINKADRNDARPVAQMMRVGLYRPLHVKTLRSQKLPHAVDAS